MGERAFCPLTKFTVNLIGIFYVETYRLMKFISISSRLMIIQGREPNLGDFVYKKGFNAGLYLDM